MSEQSGHPNQLEDQIRVLKEQLACKNRLLTSLEIVHRETIAERDKLKEAVPKLVRRAAVLAVMIKNVPLPRWVMRRWYRSDTEFSNVLEKIYAP